MEIAGVSPRSGGVKEKEFHLSLKLVNLCEVKLTEEIKAAKMRVVNVSQSRGDLSTVFFLEERPLHRPISDH